MPDRITIFRGPLCAACARRGRPRRAGAGDRAARGRALLRARRRPAARARVGVMAEADRDSWRNWGRNQRCWPAAVEQPRSVLEVVEAVAAARGGGADREGGGQRPLVHRHRVHRRPVAVASTASIASSTSTAIGAPSPSRPGITIRAAEPASWPSAGLALANLGDIDRQTIAGAISTGTHGTGARFGGLATFIARHGARHGRR